MTNRRVSLTIGCDQYSSLDCLTGAERDAQEIFRVLTDSDLGAYEASDSVLLLSPTLSGVISAFTTILRGEDIDTLTVFFAGHGGAIHGSYYLCFRDSDPSMFSTTALPLSLLFTMINEVRPAQCNIIIDACQAGGLVSDVATLLKPELIGKADTPGIAIFASSASDQYSGETSVGGRGTVQLLKCLRGDLIVQTRRPYLDLVEVGLAVSAAVSSTELNQTPLVWGLNLYGQPQLCKNVHFDGNSASSLYALTNISTHSKEGQAIRGHAELIWNLYHSDPNALTPVKLRDVLYPLISELESETAAKFMEGISTALVSCSRQAENSFAPIETLATCAALMLKFAGNSACERVAISLVDVLRAEASKAAEDLLADLSENKYALLCSGLADLYYLPLRVTRIIGWLAAAVTLIDIAGIEDPALKTSVHRVCRKLLTDYSTAIVSMSDEQTPFALIFLYAAYRHRWVDEAEQLFGGLFYSLLDVQGNLAKPFLKGDRVVEYLALRGSREFDKEFDLIGDPCEMPSLLFMMAYLFSLKDTVDPYLSGLDRLPCNVFIPSDHRDFADKSIFEGKNHGFEIGHRTWKVDDFVSRWKAACEKDLNNDPNLGFTVTKIGSVCAALVFPDRSPWFLLNNIHPLESEVINKDETAVK